MIGPEIPTAVARCHGKILAVSMPGSPEKTPRRRGVAVARGTPSLRAHLVPKNFHLEICAHPFGHVYGVLNIVK